MLRLLYSRNSLVKEAYLTNWPMSPAEIQRIPMIHTQVRTFHPSESIPIIQGRKKKPKSNFFWALSNTLALSVSWPKDTNWLYWPWQAFPHSKRTFLGGRGRILSTTSWSPHTVKEPPLCEEDVQTSLMQPLCRQRSRCSYHNSFSLILKFCGH